MTQGSPARKGDVLLLVGTRKGSFILSGSQTRKSWDLSGPHHPGSDVFHLTYDSRGEGELLAAVNNMIWGPQLESSSDLGQTWSQPKEQPRFSGDGGPTVDRLWHIEPGRENEPDVVYVGVAPAALFKTKDGGATWHEVKGLSRHASREQWQPGLGGLCLHSMVLDPRDSQRMWTGISAVGVFGTTDGGESWQPMNQGVRADFLPDPFPEFGQCTHKLLSPASRPDTLYQQNHCGVFRSESAGQVWQDISEGLPSRFGFVLGLHSQDPDTIYVLPEDQVTGQDVGGGQRYVSDAKFRVYRSRNGGDDWKPLTNGLPQKNAYLHVLREGMATDSLDPCGIYVGTTSGQIFYSRDDGDTWNLLIDYLPPINSVECSIVV
ncbi:MAG: WD40/YVTN/BNR-like repeat-containing protein [Dehalococcoidia bacterium]